MEKDGWMYWEGKKVFIILKNKRKYSGKIIDIDMDVSPIIFITMTDKFGERVSFVHSEIEVIQEERR